MYDYIEYLKHLTTTFHFQPKPILTNLRIFQAYTGGFSTPVQCHCSIWLIHSEWVWERRNFAPFLLRTVKVHSSRALQQWVRDADLFMGCMRLVGQALSTPNLDKRLVHPPITAQRSLYSPNVLLTVAPLPWSLSSVGHFQFTKVKKFWEVTSVEWGLKKRQPTTDINSQGVASLTSEYLRVITRVTNRPEFCWTSLLALINKGPEETQEKCYLPQFIKYCNIYNKLA